MADLAHHVGQHVRRKAAANGAPPNLDHVAGADVAPDLDAIRRRRRDELTDAAIVDEEAVGRQLVEVRHDPADANRMAPISVMSGREEFGP